MANKLTKDLEQPAFPRGILLRDARSGRYSKKHGLSKTPEFMARSAMIKRCYNPKCKDYKYYGARGIRVCEEWLGSFELFLSDVGFKPSAQHSLDRYPNNNGNYEPGNVRWATKKEQANNRRNNRLITFQGETKTLTEWAEVLGLPAPALSLRIIRMGWSTEEALTLGLGEYRNKKDKTQ